MEKETVQIIFLGNPAQMDRIDYLLKKAIPSKIYFLEATENSEDPGKTKAAKDMKKKIESQLPKWVIDASETVEIPFFEFSEAFPRLISIMHKERILGKEVVVNAHGGSILISTAALLAANITGSNVYWITPGKWSRVIEDGKEIDIPIGAKSYYNIKIPLELTLPSGSDSHVLKYLHKNNSAVTGRLSGIAEDIGLDNLGANLKKQSSGVVKLSKIIGRLKKDGFVETRKIGRKSFEIRLTPDKGKIIAEVLNLMENSENDKKPK